MNKLLKSVPLAITSALPTAAIGAIASLAAWIRGLDPVLLDFRSAFFIPTTAIFLFISNLVVTLAISPLTYILSLTGAFDGRMPIQLCRLLISFIGVAWIIATVGAAGSGNLFLPPFAFVAFALPISVMVYNMASRA